MLVLWAMLLESSPSLPHPQPGPGQRSAVARWLGWVRRAAPRFSLKIKSLKVRQQRGTYLQFRTHFSIRQEIYCRLSIVRCWQIPHIFHIRPPETWGCIKTQGTSSTDSFFLTPGAWAEMNRISILFFFFLAKNVFSDINAISPAINHLGIHLEIIWKTHLFGREGGVINKKRRQHGKFYLYIHAFSYSCIHSFTRPSRWLCIRPLCVCVASVCVTCGTVLLCCRLVLFPRGLSSFTEPWQKMEARERGPLH